MVKGISQEPSKLLFQVRVLAGGPYQILSAKNMKKLLDILSLPFAYVLVGLFYLVIWYGRADYHVRLRYYRWMKIPHRIMPDKFGPYVVRLDNDRRSGK